jgi:manganese transport protein
VLSLRLLFAFVPLVLFTAKRSLMGDLAKSRFVTLLASVTRLLILALNATLLWRLLP